MKFLIDAQLPESLSQLFIYKGFESLHVSQLPNAYGTSDLEILQFADLKEYVVVSKDKDFLDFLLVNNRPKQLLFLRTGNTSNKLLLKLVSTNLPLIVQQFEDSQLIELSPNELVVRK